MGLENLVGKRCYNHQIEEACTIVGISNINGEPMFADLQYDDRMAHDEAIADEPIAERVGWNPDELLSEDYELIGRGPTLEHACEEHDWFPSPDRLWDSAEQMNPDPYLQIVRCKRCGLSGDMVMKYERGTLSPTLCWVCDEVSEYLEASYVTEEYPDVPVCRIVFRNKGFN